VDDARTLLRHTLATLAYRAGKTLRGAPPAFAEFRAASGTRSAGETLAHMGDLLDWGLHLAQGHHVWRDSPPRAWEEEVARFFAALRAFDDFLATEERLGFLPGRLFQGPVADALWHTGQLALLRRLAGVPIRGENTSRPTSRRAVWGRNSRRRSGSSIDAATLPSRPASHG
jgi:hypothetical protein